MIAKKEEMSVLIVVGTRPELIKIAPVVRTIDASSRLSFRLLHTGQHYDESLNETFFRTLKLPTPDVQLEIGSGSHAEQTAEALVSIEREVTETKPDLVVAQGDTNAVLSAALATSKTTADFAHVEAGIRSYDRSMPEEVNRVITDDVSEILFAPTETAAENLKEEGITQGVHVVGNTIVDACLKHRPIAERESTVLDTLDITPNDYVVATIHRPGNTDDLERLRTIVETLDGMPFPVIFPAHPRTRQRLNSLRNELPGSLRVINPLGYLDFLKLLVNAHVVVTDSGGIQEEASIVETPCLTVRPNTERPETIEAGVNELVEPETLSGRLSAVYSKKGDQMVGATNLYGDGKSGRRIVEIIKSQYAG